MQSFKVFYFYRCKWAKFHTEEYKISSGVIVELVDDEPVIGVIKDIYIINGEKPLFYVDCFHIMCLTIEHMYWTIIPFLQNLFVTQVYSYTIQFMCTHPVCLN